jgi:hypothetical protein
MLAVIERHRNVPDALVDLVNLDHSEQSIKSLREEVHQLHLAYQSFCELVVTELVGGFSTDDFGNEWLLEEGDSDDAT